jgi:erythrin-vacuolar iron transport family protein
MRSSLQSEFATNSKSRHAKKKFSDHTEREVLAIAFASEEEDGRIYMSFAENLAERYRIQRGSSSRWRKRKRPSPHALYEQRFGPNRPPIRREDVKGFLRCRPIWLTRNLPLDTIRKEAEIMEFEAERFYAKAAEQAQDVGVRKLLGDLKPGADGFVDCGSPVQLTVGRQTAR